MTRRSFKASLRLAALLAGLALTGPPTPPAPPATLLRGDDAGSTPARADRTRVPPVAGRRRAPTIPPAPLPLAPLPALLPVVADGAAARREAWHRALPRMAGTYLPDVVREGSALAKRWGDRRHDPIRVRIAPGDSLAGWDRAFVREVREAFATWERVGLPVRFAFVDAPADAEVHVSWVEQLSDRRAGVIHWSGDADGWLVSARIELALRVSDGGAATLASLRRIALHEVGHLLGLEHSADAADVMAAWVEAGELTERDRATARLLYTLPPGAIAPGGDGADAS